MEAEGIAALYVSRDDLCIDRLAAADKGIRPVAEALRQREEIEVSVLQPEVADLALAAGCSTANVPAPDSVTLLDLDLQVFAAGDPGVGRAE